MFDYWRERFPLQLYVPLAMALASPAHLASSLNANALLIDVGFVLVLLAQFRLWDDLADRASDALRHPGRALVRARHIWRYATLCVAVAAANLAGIIGREGTPLAFALFIALIAMFGALYRRPHARTSATDLLRLAKYPVFVVIVAAGRPDAWPGTVLLGALGTFLAACAYEVWHDPATPLRVLRGNPR